MGFIIILILTTLSIAGSAAFFSIYGLAQIFAGSFWPVVVMASSLEAGKLVSASYVYRYWQQISFIMKSYLITAILILMLITSAGIFGFLSAAYQTDTLSLRDIESQIELLETEKKELRARKKEIDADVGRVKANYITKRIELINKYASETDHINTRLPILIAELYKLKSTQIQEESHVGPIIYIAKVFNQDTDDATKWMILLIIFAFDPLAVALTIATNNAMMQRKEENESLKIVDTEDVSNDESEPSFTFSEHDIIESIDDIQLDVENEVPLEPEPAIPPVTEPLNGNREGEPEPEHVMEIIQPGKVELVKQAAMMNKLQLRYPQYDITSNAQTTLQNLLTKRKEEGLTLQERQEVDTIINTLQHVAR